MVGPAGSGKSTVRKLYLKDLLWIYTLPRQFIKLASGLEIAVGHDLEPCTEYFGITRIPGPHYDIVLVDTPGFDALDLSEANILESLSNWLRTTCVYPRICALDIYLKKLAFN